MIPVTATLDCAVTDASIVVTFELDSFRFKCTPSDQSKVFVAALLQANHVSSKFTSDHLTLKSSE